MASVNKIKISSTNYDISPSPSGTLETSTSKSSYYTSNDSTTATSWTSTDAIAATDTNSSIFSKLTSMVKNIRFLYNKLGTTDISGVSSTVTGAISSLNSGLAGKAASSHSHTVSTLPVSSSQVNSTSYIPTSSLVYSMNQTLTSLNDAMPDLKTSVSNGKSAIASAITDKGVSTASDATFSTMASNIGKIPTGSTVVHGLIYGNNKNTVIIQDAIGKDNIGIMICPYTYQVYAVTGRFLSYIHIGDQLNITTYIFYNGDLYIYSNDRTSGDYYGTYDKSTGTITGNITFYRYYYYIAW